MPCGNRATTWFLLGLLVCSAHLASAQRRFEQDILNTVLNPNLYDKHVIPGNNITGSGPTEVEVNMFVRRMNVVDIPEGQLKLQLTLRQRWNDPRLTYSQPGADENHKFISVQEQDKIWTPDLFVTNEIEANVHKFSHSNSALRIFPNGDVLWSVRASSTLSCPMVFETFPFDTQTCSIRFASFGFTNQDIAFKWQTQSPVQMTSEFLSNMQHFSLLSFYEDRCDSLTTQGIHSCLRVDFQLKRMVGYYLIQIFIPCTMLVILGYLVFWISPKDIIARLILVVATFLFLATHCSRMNEKFPVGNYTRARAIDVWTGFSLTFVFIALLETLGVNLLTRRELENCGDGAGAKQNLKVNDAGGAYEDLEMAALTPETDTDEEKGGEIQKRNWPRIDQPTWSQKIDMVFRIIYPVFFALFTHIYIVVYCPD